MYYVNFYINCNDPHQVPILFKILLQAMTFPYIKSSMPSQPTWNKIQTPKTGLPVFKIT